MEIKLSINKDVNENAEYYFSQSKKLKKKIPGIENTIESTKLEIKEFQSKKDEYLKKKDSMKKIQKSSVKNWFDKFRSTYTSKGKLFVIGKDSGTNEILIKKHMETGDLVFHTEEPGSPFGLLKGGVEDSSKDEIYECCQFLACFSSQWKIGYGTADVFHVKPDQVTKKAISGEYISKGSFMIYGNKNIIKNIVLRICFGVYEEKIEIDGEEYTVQKFISGSEEFCKKKCGKRYVKIEPGTIKLKSITKELKSRLKVSMIEDLPKYIPNECKILKK